VTPRSGTQVVARARTQLGLGTAYRLGKGGRDPRVARAWDPASHECDCSGFAAWVIGCDRFLHDVPFYAGQAPNGPWLETTNLVADATRALDPTAPRGIVRAVRWEDAQPGMLVMWPDQPAKKRQGHVGVITETNRHGPTRVIHCSSGNYRTTGDAIAETPATLFLLNNAIVCRVAWIDCGGTAAAQKAA
jgi:cell wall-associated NlpC family hydrolase